MSQCDSSDHETTPALLHWAFGIVPELEPNVDMIELISARSAISHPRPGLFMEHFEERLIPRQMGRRGVRSIA